MSDGRHIVCPTCHATNRVPYDRPIGQAKCGSCHDLLFQGSPVPLGGQTFYKHIAHSDVPILVDFSADWCAPCRAMEPVFARAAGELEPEVRIAKVDTQASSDIATRYGIRAIPTMILFKGGAELGRVSGAMDLGRLLSWVYQTIGNGAWSGVAGSA